MAEGRKGKPMEKRSEAWLHFTETRDDHGNVKAECNKCKDLLARKNGTSNLWKHAELCLGVVRPSKRPRQRSPPCPPLSRTGCGSSSEREPGLEEEDEPSRDLARMIVDGYDPSIVENNHFRSFVRRLNPGFKVPSRRDVETMCDGILGVQERLDKQFERVQEELRTVYENRCQSSSDKVQEMGPEQQQLPPALPLPCAPSHPSGLSDTRESNQKEASKHLARMIAFGGYDPLLVEDECFKSFVASLSQGFQVPSCLDIQKVCDGILVNARKSRWDMVRRAPGKVSLAIGKTKLLEAEEVDYTVCHFIDDEWKHRKLVLDAYMHTAMDNVCFFASTSFKSIIEEEDVNQEHRIGDRLCVVAYDKTDDAVWYLDSINPMGTDAATAAFCVDNLANATGDNADYYKDFKEYFHDKDLADFLKEAIDYLDKAIEEEYLVWSIPLVLDPRYKLQHTEKLFKCAFGADKADIMISKVTEYLKELYTDLNEDGDTDSNDIDQLGRQWDEYHHYVNDGPIDDPTQEFDILDWWKNHSSNQYPTLARMARDFLAMPTCTKLSYDEITQARSILRGHSKARRHD
ncbi:hypothetical protein U9M48_041078 [Paspalum notatum var. saurae]|uniref:BED-type domain-containing protein n=1 Tax=Paspalum notatum var. saurae TaxID=547442 RepID=A0AAQ3UN06_PASNO